MSIRNYLTALTVLFLFFMFCGCRTSGRTGPVQYEYLLMERQGGGQLDFRIYPGENRSHLNVYVSSSDFQPVEKRFQLEIDPTNADAIDDFYKALNGQLPLKGKLKASGKLKGTWLYLRFVRGNRETEITNPELIHRFTVFEKMVRDQIELK
jgi:hypothetical protein